MERFARSRVGFWHAAILRVISLARLRQIPWFRVRLRKGAKRRDYARSRVHIINARVSHPGSKAPRFKGAQTGVEHKASYLYNYLLRFLELQQESHAFSIKGHRAQGDRSREGVARRER